MTQSIHFSDKSIDINGLATPHNPNIKGKIIKADIWIYFLYVRTKCSLSS